MRILVTGGAGFIASHIVDALIELGHEVTVVDNMRTGRMENVHPQAKLHVIDILHDQLEAVFAQASPEVVIHHAAQIDVQTSLQRPAEDAQINIIGTIKLLEHCRTYGVRKLIYASSAAVYGAPEYLGVDERHPLAPISFYGVSKLTPERYIQVFSELYGLDYTILRYANVYGPRQDPKGEGGVVSIFLGKLLNEEIPLIFGDGEQTRDFIYVKDIVSANVTSLDKGSRAVVNISSNSQITVNDLLRMMCGICGVPFAPHYAAPRAGDIVHSRLDNGLAEKLLGWSPGYSLEEGLRETIGYYRAKSGQI